MKEMVKAMGLVDGIKAISEPATKLIDAVSNAIGKAYEPRYRRRIADADAYRIKRIAEELRKNSDLPIVYNGSEPVIDISDYDELRKRAGYRLAYQEVSKQENIEAVVEKAFIELDGKELESNDAISPEWMNRFVNMAGEISTEEMQNIWAKVLAGEVIRPSAYSMKTLECLRNLSVKDAKLFGKIANYVISEKMIYGDNDLNQKYNISYTEMLALDDCGLINSSGMIVLECKVHREPDRIFDFGKYILLAKSENERTFTLSQFPLTRAGRELLAIARTKEIEDQYIADVVKSVKKVDSNVQFTLHKVINRTEDTIQYETKNTELSGKVVE